MTIRVSNAPSAPGLGVQFARPISEVRIARHHPHSRRVWRSRLIQWVLRNKGLVAAGTAGAIGLIVAETAIVAVFLPATAFTWWLLGLFQATVVAAYLHVLHSAFLATDREAIWHLRGAWGEDNTRSELQRAKRDRLIWGWVDSINLQAGDLDHLVVTRHGGLVAIDSKWRNQAHGTVEMAQAARRVRTRAEGLAHSLLRAERGARHRAKENPLRVTPVVVLWGAAQRDVPEHARVDGIAFVAGRQLNSWLRQLDGDPVDKDVAADIIDRLERYRSSTRKQSDLTRR